MRITGHYDELDWYGIVTVDGKPLDPGPSQKVRNHSPDGFSWSYSGSGPAQLSLAILLAAGFTGDEAQAFYQDFKREFIAGLPRDSFSLDVDVKEWVARVRARKALYAIQEVMSGKEWGADTLDAIAELVEGAGYELKNYEAGGID